MKKVSVLVIVIILAVTLGLLSGCNPPPKEGVESPTGSKDSGPQTFLPKDMTPKEYVSKYYKLVVEDKLDESYKMLPAENKEKQKEDDYKSMHGSLNIKSFKITKVEKKEQSQAISVSLSLEGYSGWNVVWTFVPAVILCINDVVMVAPADGS